MWKEIFVGFGCLVSHLPTSYLTASYTTTFYTCMTHPWLCNHLHHAYITWGDVILLASCIWHMHLPHQVLRLGKKTNWWDLPIIVGIWRVIYGKEGDHAFPLDLPYQTCGFFLLKWQNGSPFSIILQIKSPHSSSFSKTPLTFIKLYYCAINIVLLIFIK